MSELTPPLVTTLSVDDPLSGQEVTIAITLPGSDRPREARPVLVSVGQPGATPALQTGSFGDLMPLIKTAWLAVATQLESSPATETPDPHPANNDEDDEDVADAGDNDDDATTIATAPVVAPYADPTPPKPQISNLSLF